MFSSIFILEICELLTLGMTVLRIGILTIKRATIFSELNKSINVKVYLRFLRWGILFSKNFNLASPLPIKRKFASFLRGTLLHTTWFTTLYLIWGHFLIYLRSFITCLIGSNLSEQIFIVFLDLSGRRKKNLFICFLPLKFLLALNMLVFFIFVP